MLAALILGSRLNCWLIARMRGGFSTLLFGLPLVGNLARQTLWMYLRRKR